MTGIEYPTISVGKHENLTVRMSLAAQVLMRRRGLDITKPGALQSRFIIANPNMRLQTDPPTVEGENPDAVSNMITAFSCMVVDNFVDGIQPSKLDLNAAPTADYWATLITDFPAVERAVMEALKKAAEERRAKLAAVPPTQEAAS